MKRQACKGTIRIMGYNVVSRAVEEGVVYGWNRAHKHTETPTEEAIKEAIEQAVLNELCEVLEFGDGGEG